MQKKCFHTLWNEYKAEGILGADRFGHIKVDISLQVLLRGRIVFFANRARRSLRSQCR